MTQEEKAQRIGIIEQAREIAALDLDRLLTTDRLGTELSFARDRDVFERCLSFAKRVTPQNLDRLPPGYLVPLMNYFRAVTGALKDTRDFTINRDDALQHRARIVRRIDESLEELLRAHPAVTVLFAEFGESVGRLVSRIEAEMQNLVKTHEETVQKQSAKAEEILAKARQASGAIAVKGYASFFQEEAKASRLVAMLWLAATGLTGLLLLAILVNVALGLEKTPPAYTTQQAFIIGAAKLAVFSVAVFFVAWCGRNFKAQWHVFITNKHRANALNSIEAFANASKSDANREAILVHGCAAIFSQTNTGFVPDGADAPGMPSILEVVRRSSD